MYAHERNVSNALLMFSVITTTCTLLGQPATGQNASHLIKLSKHLFNVDKFQSLLNCSVSQHTPPLKKSWWFPIYYCSELEVRSYAQCVFGETGAPTKTGEGPNRCWKTEVVGPGESTGASQGGSSGYQRRRWGRGRRWCSKCGNRWFTVFM